MTGGVESGAANAPAGSSFGGLAATSAQPADRWSSLIIIMLVYAINIADRYVVSTLIEPIKAEFVLSDSAVGILTGAAMALFYVSAGIPLAMLADRMSRKVLIFLSLATWSAMTALCGLSKTFVHLLIARIFVGIGEAGGTPPSQSLLADKFLPRSRGVAMTIFALGASIGAALGSLIGGHLNDAYGWRMVLIVFGALGLPIALLVLFAVREPKRGALDVKVPEKHESIAETFRFMLSQKSLMHVFAGGTVITFWGWGLVWWTPAFLVRSHGMTVGEAGEVMGLMHLIGGTAITLLTALALHFFSQRDPRYQAWLIGATTIAATVPSVLAYCVSSTTLSVAMLWLFVPIIYLYIGPAMALLQNLAPATMRAQTAAIMVFVCNVANLVFAPVLIGAASDFLAPRIADSQQSLAYALAASGFTGLWAAWHFFAAGKSLKQDQIAAGTYHYDS